MWGSDSQLHCTIATTVSLTTTDIRYQATERGFLLLVYVELVHDELLDLGLSMAASWI